MVSVKTPRVEPRENRDAVHPSCLLAVGTAVAVESRSPAGSRLTSGVSSFQESGPVNYYTLVQAPEPHWHAAYARR
jgi:hypothetical protein